MHPARATPTTRLGAAWVATWDRMSASDPGLLRLQNALNVAGSVLLTLGALVLLGTAVPQLVVGGLLGMVAAFAISDPQPADQARTLACGLPVACTAMALGTFLYPHRIAADAVFVALVFTAVYIRRYGPRGTGLGLIGFQSYFVSQFAHATATEIPHLLAIAALAFGACAVVRFALVRTTPQRTLARLQRAFAVRWAAGVQAAADLTETLETEPQPSTRQLRRSTTRLHQCALMIHARLDAAVDDPRAAALLEIRFAEAEVAAERLGRLLIRTAETRDAEARTDEARDAEARGTAAADGKAAPDAEPGSGFGRIPEALKAITAPVLSATARKPEHDEPGDEPSAALDHLLAYRDPARIPRDQPPQRRDIHRAAGDLAYAALGLSAVLRGERVETPPAPSPAAAQAPEHASEAESARCREELVTEGELRAMAEADRATPAKTAGLRRRTTRLACQVAVGSALAIAGGELLSEQRWYWAVLTCWVVFINTSSTGEILIKGYRRVIGTIAGVLSGGLLAAQLAPYPWAAFALAIACVFGMFFTAAVSYSLMSFFVTTMIGLLYTLLGTFSANVLELRIEETALGAACGFIAATVVLPVRIGRRTDEQLRTVLDRLGETVRVCARRITTGRGRRPSALPLRAARELDAALDALRSSMEPVIHPANPLRPRRQRALYLARLLDTCAYHARALAALAQSSRAWTRIDAENAKEITAAAERVEHNACVLVARLRATRPEPSDGAWLGESGEPGVDASGAAPPVPGTVSGAVTRVLRHLRRIDEGLAALARLLGVADED